MNSGKWVTLALLVATALGGLGVWYAQTRAWWSPLEVPDLTLSAPDGSAVSLAFQQFDGVAGSSSPLRYRVCFQLEGPVEPLLAAAMPYDDPVPLVAPAWFDCYDAEAISSALARGEATAVLGARNVVTGFDRVVAIFPDGRGYAWHQLNGTLE